MEDRWKKFFQHLEDLLTVFSALYLSYWFIKNALEGLIVLVRILVWVVTAIKKAVHAAPPKQPPLPERAAPADSSAAGSGAPSPSVGDILAGLCATLFWVALGAMFFCILRGASWWGMAMALGGAELCCVGLLIMMWWQRTRSSASPRSLRLSPAIPPLGEVFGGQCCFLFVGSQAAMLLSAYRDLPWGVGLAMQGVAFSSTCLIIYLWRRKRASVASGPDKAAHGRDATPPDKQDS